MMREMKMGSGTRGWGAALVPLLALGILLGAVRDAAGQQGEALHTALAISLDTGDLSEVERLLASGAPVDARSGSGMTPLMSAAFAARPRIVERLLEHGADPNAATPGGVFVLQYALMGEGDSGARAEIVRMLMAAGADPGRLPGGGAQTIALAEMLGHGEAVRILRGDGRMAEAPPVPVARIEAVRWRSIHPMQAVNWRTSGLTCGLSDAEELYCWGSVTLGDGDPHPIGIYPERIGGGQSFASFHLSTSACGIRPSGEAYCWQDLGAVVPEIDMAATGRTGELVFKPSDRTRGPEVHDRVAPGLALEVLDGGWGGGTTCALDASGRAYCWGAAALGQLGDGRARTWDREPQPVAGGRTYRALGVGAQHACALDHGGIVHCWGANDLGQLGQGTAAEPCGDPSVAAGMLAWLQQAAALKGKEIDVTEVVEKQYGTRPCMPRPVPVAGGTVRFTSIAVGAQHACAVGTDGAAYCWGSDQYGQVTGMAAGEAVCESWPGGAEDVARYGLGCRTTPTRVPLPGAVRQVGAGELHSCALGVDGSVHCWGTMPRSAPSRQPPMPSCVGMFSEVARPDGEDLFLCRTGPTRVEIGAPLETIVAGAAHTCGLTRTGEAYCWGYNGWGQLGDGSWKDSARGVRVRPGRVHPRSL